MKKLSTTKKLLVFSDGMAALVTVVCMLVCILTDRDAGVLMSIAAAWIGEAAVFHGFYAWKEKNANRSKFAQLWVERYADRYGVDAAARIAEIVLKE